MTEPLRIVFAGTPDFAAAPLQAMIAADYLPVAVYSQPDRPAGRGRKLQASPVKQLAQEHEIPVYQPQSLRKAEAQEQLAALKPDLMIVVAYGLILPAEVLATPRYGCWNIHASLLPRWRGAAPIQRAIEAGDSESGVCIMQMDEGLDTGPVLHTLKTRLDDQETGGSLHNKLAGLGSEALLHCLGLLQANDLPAAEEQDHSQACYARKLDKKEAELDWQTPAVELERRIRAFNPWPVCWFDFQGERLRIWKAEALRDSTSDVTPGSMVSLDSSGLVYVTSDGLLKMTELQRPGGRRVSAADFYNAFKARD